jgi:hypothetical protein
MHFIRIYIMGVQKLLIRPDKSQSSEAIDKNGRKSIQWDIVHMHASGFNL